VLVAGVMISVGQSGENTDHGGDDRNELAVLDGLRFRH
jgi:hypothetical protein